MNHKENPFAIEWKAQAIIQFNSRKVRNCKTRYAHKADTIHIKDHCSTLSQQFVQTPKSFAGTPLYFLLCQ